MKAERANGTASMLPKRRPPEAAAYGIIFLLSASVIALAAFLIGTIIHRGLPAISIPFLTSASNPILGTIGVFPSIVNTLYIVFSALLISVPVGVGGAIYLNEYAKNGKIVEAIEFAAETLAGIPSILYGVFGYIFFCLIMKLNVSLVAGALTLSIMTLPILMRTTQEALKTVPNAYRNGALSLGATKLRLIRTILLPCSLKGILTGIILSVGRMVSESAALLLVSGGNAMYMPRGNIADQMSRSGSTLSVELYRHAMSRGDNETAFGIAAILMAIVIILNLLTRFLAGRLNKS